MCRGYLHISQCSSLAAHTLTHSQGMSGAAPVGVRLCLQHSASSAMSSWICGPHARHHSTLVCMHCLPHTTAGMLSDVRLSDWQFLRIRSSGPQQCWCTSRHPCILSSMPRQRQRGWKRRCTTACCRHSRVPGSAHACRHTGSASLSERQAWAQDTQSGSVVLV